VKRKTPNQDVGDGVRAGDLRQRKGTHNIEEAGHDGNRRVDLTAAGLAHSLWLSVTNVKIWIGFFFLVGFMASYMTVLSWADYSYVMPVGAFGYAMLTFFAVVVLHEHVSARRWIGVLVVCFGVLLVGMTKPRTTETA
jgi:drug/metabolite transporter (DMT)-like permease